MSTLTKREYPESGLSLANFFPNFESWAVGFDRPMRLLDEMSNALMGRNTSFPPYNIKQVGDDRYQIEMAVAGFSKQDLKIELANNQLTVEGSQESSTDSAESNYLYKGIAARQFRQSFALEDHVKVLGSELKDGVLKIELERQIPEEKKPRSIQIK
jgi:molecular chaperone IbpA